MLSILVYETLSGGGFGPIAPPAASADDAFFAQELLPQGVAMRDTIVEGLQALDGLQISVVESGPAPWRARPGTHRSPVSVRTLRPGESEALALGRWSAEHDAVWVVAPETEGRLAAAARAVDPARWAGSDAATLAQVGRKSAACAAMQAAGLRTPLDPGFADAPEWVLKPDQGAGAEATWRLPRDLAHARAAEAVQRGQAVCVQPWVEGEAMSLSLRLHARGAEVLSLNRQDLRQTPDGALHFEGVAPLGLAESADRLPACQAVAEGLRTAFPGLRGLIGVDLVWPTRGEPVLIEINARWTLAFVALAQRTDLGARALVAAHLQACGFEIGVPHACV